MSTKTTDNSLIPQLADQLDYHWTNQLRPRLDGLTDDEYFWQPVPDCWTVHPDGSIDFTYPEPDPAPFTTIAWRLAHVIVGVLAVRNHSHFGGPAGGLPELAVRHRRGDRAAPARRRICTMDRRRAGFVRCGPEPANRAGRGPYGPNIRCPR